MNYSQEEFEYIVRKGYTEAGQGCCVLARQLCETFPNEGISFDAWKSRVTRFVQKEGLQRRSILMPKPKEQDEKINDNGYKQNSIERKADGSYVYDSIIEIMENETVTPERMLEAHHLDIGEWEVVSYKNNYWSQQAKEGKKVILYQSKLVVKPRAFDNIAESVVLEHFMQKAKLVRKIDTSTVAKVPKTDTMLEINICDLHLGKLAFDNISGDTYNVQLAKERFDKYIRNEYQRALSTEVEKILFVWSNDFFNFDGINYATTGGTPQQSGINWQTLFLEGVDMLVNAIRLLSTVAPVKTFYIASNHSRQADFYALCYVQAWFKNDKNVEVIINTKSRYFEKYGINLIGFSHSYYEKENNLYHLMANECPDWWAETTYREFHLAHYHSEKVKEVGGVIYRWLPTVCGTDDYHYEKGYIGSVKRCYSFLYDKHIGLIQINCTII